MSLVTFRPLAAILESISDCPSGCARQVVALGPQWELPALVWIVGLGPNHHLEEVYELGFC